jgi:phosphoribosyl-ATP pyrophosphohydrolase
VAKSDKRKTTLRPRKVPGKPSGKLSRKPSGKLSTKPSGKQSEKLSGKFFEKASGKPSRKSKKSLIADVIAPPADYGAAVLDRLFAVVESRRDADPTISHSARLLSRGSAKVAQKFGEEAVECLIEAVAGNREALIAESADVLYHLLVLWVSSGVSPADVWLELIHREGISGIAEKAARAKPAIIRQKQGTTKIP